MAQLDQLRNHLAEVELLAQLNLDGSAHAHGDPISVPARISSGDRGRILFLQSGSPESALRCLEVLQTAVFTDVRLLYITPTTHAAPARTNLPSDTEVVVTGNSLVELLSLRALIRRADFESCVLMLTGEPGFRRFKLFGLTLWHHHLLVFNENGDCFFFSFGKMSRHLLWRLREKTTPDRTARHLKAAWKIFREDGFRELSRWL